MKRQLSNVVNCRHARVILLSRGGMSNAEIALGSPKALIGMNCWSLPKLREYLIEQKIVGNISISWLREILIHRKVRWRHTKTWKESTDPQFWPKYRAIRRLYKHPPPQGRVICVDEFGPLNLQPRGGICLTGPGKHVERRRATYNRRGGVRHMFGVYDMKTNRLSGIFTSGKNWVEFLSFLRWVRRRYAQSGTLHIVLDNASFHLKTGPDLGRSESDSILFHAEQHFLVEQDRMPFHGPAQVRAE
jgi:hypothetical protein